jgi:hypothetical protein
LAITSGGGGSIAAVTEFGEQSLEQQLEEIRAQLDWARGYL